MAEIIVKLEGHIIDSLTLSKVFDEILLMGGNYHSEEVIIGQKRKDVSSARIRVEAPDNQILETILSRLHQLGCIEETEKNVTLISAEQRGVFPEGFYATSNLDTEIYKDEKWIQVENCAMDCGILYDPKSKGASCVKMSEVQQGESYVVGIQGVRVHASRQKEKKQAFAFMDSGVSTERPKEKLIQNIALEMKELKDKEGSVLVVCGPAVVHTGAREYLARLIREGYIHKLFAGNALATHDIEAALYGTSLGMDLQSGLNISGGHRNHLYAINQIRSCGSIQQSVQKGVLKSGIMYECINGSCDFLLAGSIRDDGPLPDVITDCLQAQKQMREKLKNVRLVIMLATMLHSIATGNLLPASTKTICVDINPTVVTKLMDRGSHQAVGIVMSADAFLHQLCEDL